MLFKRLSPLIHRARSNTATRAVRSHHIVVVFTILPMLVAPHRTYFFVRQLSQYVSSATVPG